MAIDIGFLSPELNRLGLALGVLKTGSGGQLDFNPDFFADPATALREVLTDPARRSALLALLVDLLGEATGGEIPHLPQGKSWFPLPIGNGGAATAYVVVEVNDGFVDIGIAAAADHQAGGDQVQGAIWLPLIRSSTEEPAELLPGRPGGELGVRFGIRLAAADPGAPVSLLGVTGEFLFPTDGTAPRLKLTVDGLRLTGWPQARDIELAIGSDGFAETLAELSSVLLDLLAASAAMDQATAARLHQLLTLVGLGNSAEVPRLRLDDLIERGAAVLREWAESIVGDASGQRQTAWLRVLARFAGIPDAVVDVTPAGGLRVRLTSATDVLAVHAHLAVSRENGQVNVTLGASASRSAAPLGTVPVSVQARVDVLRFGFGGDVTVDWLPLVRVQAAFGDAGVPLVAGLANADFAIRALRLGLGSTDGRLYPVVEAEQVRIGEGDFPLLDLTSADAVTQAAGQLAKQQLNELLAPLLGDVDERLDALLVVVGLADPPGTAGWPRPATAALFSDPFGEIARFHARVLGVGEYRHLANAAAVLFGVTDDVPGDGTRGDPWRLLLPNPEPVDIGTVEVLIWGEGGAAAPSLVVAARVTLDPVVVADGTELLLHGLFELIRTRLPVAEGERPQVTFADRHEIGLRLSAGVPVGLSPDDIDDVIDPDEPPGQPQPPAVVPPPRLALDAGLLVFSCTRVEAAVRWQRGPGWTGALGLSDGAIDVGTLHLTLPDPFSLDWFRGNLDLEGAWPAIRLLLGARLAMPALSLPDLDLPGIEWPKLGGSEFDWPDLELPSLSLPHLFAAFLGWLPAAGPLRLRLPDGFTFDLELPEFGGGDWPSLSLPELFLDPLGALRLWLGEFFTGSTDFSLPAISLGAILVEAPDVTGTGTYDDPWAVRTSRDPDAPELLVWLDPDGPTLAGLDDVFAELLPDDLLTAPQEINGLLGVLAGAQRLTPGLRDLMSDRPALETAAAAVRSAAVTGDGLLSLSQQQAPGDTAVPITASHLNAPARFVLADHTQVDPAEVVYLCAPLPGVASWPGQNAGQVVDLRTSDQATVPANGPWFVLLPTRAAAGGHEQIVARLRGFITAIGRQPVVVAHSVTAYPARAVHAEGWSAQLITVCGPAGPNGVTALADNRVLADGVRFLHELSTRIPAVPAPLQGPLETLTQTIGHEAPFPLADFAPPPMPAAAPPVIAVVARQLPADVDLGLATLVHGVVTEILKLLPVGGGDRAAVTHAGFGVRMALPHTAVAGDVDVATTLRLDLHRVQFRPGRGRPVPRAVARTVLSRPGSWLVDTSQARIRWAEVVVDLAAGGSRLTIVLHEASLPGTILRTRRITLSTLDTTARVLLGELAAALSPLPPTGPLADLAALLRAIEVARTGTGDVLVLDPDAVERVFADPSRHLRNLSADALAASEHALRELLGVPVTGPLRIPLAPGWWLAAGDPPGTLTLGTDRGVRIADTITVSGFVRISDLAVSGHLEAGPLVVDIAPDGTTATVGPGVALLPVPDGPGLARFLGATAFGQAVRMAVQSVASTSAELTTLLHRIGLLEPVGRLRDPVGLFTSPADWLLAPAALGSTTAPGRVSPARVAGVLDAIAKLVDAYADRPGVLGLPLPRGGHLTAVADGDDLVLTATLTGNADTGELAAGGRAALTIRIGPQLIPAFGVTATAHVAAATGVDAPLAAAEIEVATGAAGVRLVLRLWPEPDSFPATVELFPNPSGLAELTRLLSEEAAAQVLPMLLDELAGLSGPLAGLATAIRDLGDALSLRDPVDGFDADELRTLAKDLPAGFATRFRANPAGVIAALGAAAGLTGAGSTVAGKLWATVSDHVQVSLVPSESQAPQLSVLFTGLAPLNGVTISGRVTAGPDGLGPSFLAVTVVPADPNAPDPIELVPGAWPYAEVHVGVANPHFESGLWLDPPGTPTADALAVRLPIGSPAALIHRRGTTSDDDIVPALVELVREVVLPLVLDPVLGLDSVRTMIKDAKVGASSLGKILVKAGILSSENDPHLLPASLAEPLTYAIRAAVELIGAALADVGLGDLPIRLTLTGTAAGDRTRFALGVVLTKPVALPDLDDVRISLRADPAEDPAVVQIGLVELLTDLSLPNPVTFAPRIRVHGLGFEATGVDGPLVPDGLRIQSIALYGEYEHALTGFVAGGAKLELTGVELPLAAGSGGDNPVASKVIRPDDTATANAGPGPAPGISPNITIRKVGTNPVEVRFGLAATGWIPIRRSFGPIYIEQVGYDLDTYPDALAILVDGGVLIGPLAAGIDDLAVIIPLATPANPATWRLDLAGLAISLDGDSVSIAGGLQKLRRLGGVEYIGMLDVRAAGYGLTALGAYGQFPVPGATGGQRYSSLFIIAGLAATLGGPPAFFVLGVGAGIGLNRRLIAPASITDVPGFPMIAALDPGSQLIRDPMGALTRLGETFPPQPGAFWLAAGVRFSSFALVESIVALTVSIGDGLEIMLLGLARAGLPSPKAPAVVLELALMARFSSAEGVLSVQAQLTENSYLFDRSCQLTGGFAFVIWFRTGEFVVTIGGYHPRYRRLPHQPDVPRVGFAWSVGEAITIKGGAYFALTPTCIMTGGRLEAAADFGLIGAWFAAGLDILLSWDPFFYDISVYVTVGAFLHIEVKIWFIRISVKITVSVGADLLFVGPPLHGIAVVDLGVVKVEVPFGDSAEPAKAWLGWSTFHDKYLVAGDPGGLTMDVAVDRGAHTPDPGAATPAADGVLRVQPEFVFRTSTRAASTTVNGSVLPAAKVDVAPMGISGVTSMHTVSVRAAGTQFVQGGLVGGTVAPVSGQVPDALWRTPTSTGEGGMRTAYTGAEFTATVKIVGTTPEIAVDQRQRGESHPLPLLLKPDPKADLETAAAAALAWTKSVAGQDPLTVAAKLMATPAATFARCLGRAVAAATAAGPSAFEISLLATERTAPPRLERVTARAFQPPRPSANVVTRKRPVPPVPTPPPVPPPILIGLLRPDASRQRRPLPRTTVGRWGANYPRLRPPDERAVLAAARPAAFRLHRVAPPGVATIKDASGTEVRRMVRRGPVAGYAPSGGRVETLRGAFIDDVTFDLLARLQQDIGTGTGLLPGEVQVWDVPGAAGDWAPKRPQVEIAGNQVVRVCVLDRAGAPLAEALLSEGKGSVDVPEGAHRIVLLGTGVPSGPHGLSLTSGLSGWHIGVHVVRAGDYGYVIPGGVLRTPGATVSRSRRPVDVALVDPVDVVRGAGVTQTTLPPEITCVVVAIRAIVPDASAAELVIGLDGTAATGAERVVTVGDDIYVVRALKASGSPAVVTVGHDHAVALLGVLGTVGTIDMVADQLAADGAAALTPGLVTSPIANRQLVSSVIWRPA